MTTDTEQKSLTDFISENQITLTFDYADSNPNMPDSGHMDHYRVTLYRRKQGTEYADDAGLLQRSRA